MPVRYAQHPAIICPLTIPNQVGYVRCRDFSALGCFPRVDGVLARFIHYITVAKASQSL